MEKLLRHSINKKQNGLQQSKHEKSSTLPSALRKNKVTFSMAIGNGERLVVTCCMTVVTCSAAIQTLKYN